MNKTTNNKCYRITVRITQDEYNHLEQRSKESDCGKAEYVRRMIMSKPVLKIDTRNDLKELRTELLHVGNNLNQIAHSLNGNYYHFPAELPAVRDAIEKVNQALYIILKRLS